MSTSRIASWSIGIVIVAVLVAIAVVVAIRVMDRDADENEGRAADRRPVVEATQVSARTIRQTVRGVGTIRSPQNVTLAPEINAMLREIHFREGEVVEAGQLMFELDDRKLQRRMTATEASLRAARARQEDARRTFERLEQLREQRVASSEELDRARSELDALIAEVEQLAAQVELSKEEVADTRIVAPFDGVVSQRLIDVGNFVQVGDPLARMYQIDPLEIEFRLPERYAGRIEHGLDVHVHVAAFEDEVFIGEVHFVSPVVEEQTRDYLIKAMIENSDGRLRPGFFGDARLVIEERVDRPVVPERALVATRTGYVVFVITDDDVAEMVEVQIGLRQNGYVEIIDGPEIGTRIVETGQLRVSDGSQVRIIAETTPADDPPSASAGSESDTESVPPQAVSR